jgi:hypothetical protein
LRVNVAVNEWLTERATKTGRDWRGLLTKKAIRSAYAAGTGSAVTDLIFSIAKREVTFFSGTALINFL